MKWISTKDKLPDYPDNDSVEVIITIQMGKNKKNILVEFGFYSEEGWLQNSGNPYSEIYKITHWMYLPNPPKK